MAASGRPPLLPSSTRLLTRAPGPPTDVGNAGQTRASQALKRRIQADERGNVEDDDKAVRYTGTRGLSRSPAIVAQTRKAKEPRLRQKKFFASTVRVSDAMGQAVRRNSFDTARNDSLPGTPPRPLQTGKTKEPRPRQETHTRGK
jgi:hypothetical protein